MVKEISIDEAIDTNASFIDVRSEGEFAEATIPGAVNIPLLQDEARAQVGKVYKEEGAEIAKEMGLKLVSPRLPAMVREVREIARRQPVVVFCWRGGLRSKSFSSVLETMGIPVTRLIGGYKAYRRFVNNYLNRMLPHKIIVLHGLTGVGKTEVLQNLQRMGISAIDLEGLAHNRGSVFGNIGMPPQPSQKMFEGRLAAELRRVEQSGYAVVECESRRIGRIILPRSLTDGMRDGLHILLYCSMDCRVQRLVEVYTAGADCNREALSKAISALEKRVGKAKVGELTAMLHEDCYAEVAGFLLQQYYDPLYHYPSGPDAAYNLSVDAGNPLRAAKEIKEYITKLI